MMTVDAPNGIKYGFRLLGYFIGISVLTSIIFIIGFIFLNVGSGIIGLALFPIGVSTFLAGVAGILYKIIADGIEEGMNAASK